MVLMDTGPLQVLCDVNTEGLQVVHNLHRCLINDGDLVVPLLLHAKVHHQFLALLMFRRRS